MRRLAMCLVVFAMIVSLLNTIPVNTSPIYVLSTTGFKRVLFYYGWLDTSNILDYEFDILVFSGAYDGTEQHMIPVLKVIYGSVEIYAYLHNGTDPIGLGSSYKEMVIDEGKAVSEWIDAILDLVNRTVNAYTYDGELLITGIFFDEADPSYLGTTDQRVIDEFIYGVQYIVNETKSYGLKVFINGVRGFAEIADYYLWEDFISAPQNGSYVFDTDFLYDQDNGNPYEWENGYGKYLWLKQHGLLSKTIALTFADIDTIENAVIGYYVARMLGLAGYAYAPENIYASGGAITELYITDLGPVVAGPFIDLDENSISAVFMLDEVVVDFNNRAVSIPVYKYAVDGKPYEYTWFATVSGSSVNINKLSYNATTKGMYIYINATYLSQEDVLLHIYIDADGDGSTGYQPYGAEMLVEAYNGSTAGLYNYTGSGSDWSWTDMGRVDTVHTCNGLTCIIELRIPYDVYVSSSKMYIRAVHNYGDDAGYDIDISTIHIVPIVSLLPEKTNLARISNMIPIIVSIVSRNNGVDITVNASTGLHTYTFHVPFKVVEVLKNGRALKKYNVSSFSGEGYYVLEGNHYSKVLVRVYHHSPVTISILSTLPKKSLGGTVESPLLRGDTTTVATIVALTIISVILVSCRRK